MAFVGPNIWEMTDQPYNGYLEHCERISDMLGKAIDLIMAYILQGRVRSPSEWETLFKALNQAVFIREYLNSHCANLLTIAEDFLAQMEDWQQELRATLN
jgi:hypothetical protein